MENPFYNPTTLQDPKKLIGRDQHLARIFSMLKNWQSASIVGVKRIGKTSLLTCLKNEEVQRRFGFPVEDFLFISIDLPQIMSKNVQDFFHNVNYQIRKKAQKYLSDMQKATTEHDEFYHLLDVLDQQSIHVVLMIDTFDVIKEYTGADLAFFGFLRSLGNGLVTYVTASIQKIDAICPPDENDLGSPFFNIFQTVPLGPFTREEGKEMLMTFSSAENLPFTENEVCWILEHAGPHPYFLQNVGAVLFQEKQVYGTEQINWERVRKESYEHLIAHFKHSWLLLDKDEREVLKQEVLQNSRNEVRPELSKSGLFRSYLDELVQVNEPALGKYVWVTIRFADFSKILTVLDDTKKLATLIDKTNAIEQAEEIPLAHTTISFKVPASKSNEPLARYTTLRESIQEAFQKMQGPDMRSDHATDWLLYNILYYRYRSLGKQHLHHKQIAARLLISERHYYRKLEEAHETLWNNLFEIAAGADSSGNT